MRYFRLLLLSLLLAVPAMAQMQPVSWKAEAVQVEGNTYEIRATGTIAGAWHIYDLTDYGSSGPNGTIFTVEDGGKVRLVGDPYISSEVHRGYDDVFGIEIGTCDSPVVICQKVELLQGNEVSVPVTVEWQACNDENCIPPDDYTMNVTLPGGEGLPVFTETAPAAAGDPNAVAPGEGKSIWGLILEAIAWGFVALLTPCVFPMIPMTVSFFLKQNQVAEGEEKKKGRGKWLASIFGLSIVALYTLPIAIIILITYFAGGETVTADIFNWLATHWLPNIIFFLIFMIFAASFFGAFEITLPSSWLNKSDAKSNKGGLAGVFFVALTLVLVSFSCTGPIVGSVLIKSTQGQFWEPIITMLAFSIAFALPFTLLAFAPSLLDKLPKSGGWLNSVKVVLGFVEVALGFKFLSVADQTYHWGLLDREVYLAIWIVVFTLLGLYLLGKIRFEMDSPVQHLSVFRLILVIIDFTFVVYMIPGMWGAPLKALSGYLPPITTQDFVLDPNQHGGGGTTYVAGQPQDDGNGVPASRKYADFLHMPYDIPAFFDYEEARAYAAAVGKPMLLDFTGHGCVNCREMESRVWSDPRVLKLMKNDYVVCSLYGDDKKVLDKADWVTTEDGKLLKSLGKINSYFMMKRYHVNAQPYYIILDPVTEKNKVPARSYNLDVDEYVAFLEKGLE
ncbi:MAG: thioredoxin family protein [Bacteroidales bacterium]|nr:thioredoxin family protein [Bacteroidales bacterium]